MSNISEEQSKIMNFSTPSGISNLIVQKSSSTLHCCSFQEHHRAESLTVYSKIEGIELSNKKRKNFHRSWKDSPMNALKAAALLDLVCPGGQHDVISVPFRTNGRADLDTFESGDSPGLSSPAASIHEAEDRANGVIRGILVVLRHHGAPHPVVDSFLSQARAYLVHPDEATFFKRAKYLTVAPMARFLKNEMPKCSAGEIKFTGQFAHWAKPRLKTYCRKNVHLWYSFLQAKRAALPLSEELVLTTYEEHRKAMEIEDPIDDNTHESVMKVLEPHLKVVRREMRRRLSSPDGQSSLSHTPSTSACQEVSRGKGGQAAEIRSYCPILERHSIRASASVRVNPELRRMNFYPKLVVNGVVRYNVTIEEFEYSDGLNIWKDTISQATHRYIGQRLTCTIQAVIEPLKIRVISKGEAVPYYASKDLQKALHGAMREMDCYRLIGRPLCPTDLFDLSNNRVEGGTGPEEWFSIDYSAATDNLSARLSSSIMEYLIDGFSEHQKALYRSVLAPHHVEYPEGFDVAPVDQKNGQLMGSILSFPVLCIANLGLYLENIKDDPRPLEEKLKGVLVNGDDMLYVARQSRWQTHIEIGKKVGLNMSPGKAYHHTRYANANSACFDYNLEKESSTPWSIPFLNTGLYFNQSKVLQDDRESQRGFCSTINRLVQGALPGKAPELLKQFMHKHRALIAEECKGRNLFVPQSLGGMGVERPHGFETTYHWTQKAQAMRILKGQPHGWLGYGPMPGPLLTEAAQVLPPWEEIKLAPKSSRALGKRHTFDLLADAWMETPMQICTYRVHDGPVEPRRPTLSPEKQTWSDYLYECVSYDDGIDYVSPWVQVGRDLDACLTVGLLHGQDPSEADLAFVEALR